MTRYGLLGYLKGVIRGGTSPWIPFGIGRNPDARRVHDFPAKALPRPCSKMKQNAIAAHCNGFDDFVVDQTLVIAPVS